MNSSVDKKKELGLWLKLLLTKHGLRQNKLAAELGVTCQYVSQICVGKTSLPLNHFDRIHKLLLSQGASDDDLKKPICMSTPVYRCRTVCRFPMTITITCFRN